VTLKSAPRSRRPSRWVIPVLRWDVAVLSALVACIVVALLVLVT